jgi:hypothetical protein
VAAGEPAGIEVVTEAHIDAVDRRAGEREAAAMIVDLLDMVECAKDRTDAAGATGIEHFEAHKLGLGGDAGDVVELIQLDLGRDVAIVTDSGHGFLGGDWLAPGAFTSQATGDNARDVGSVSEVITKWVLFAGEILRPAIVNNIVVLREMPMLFVNAGIEDGPDDAVAHGVEGALGGLGLDGCGGSCEAGVDNLILPDAVDGTRPAGVPSLFVEPLLIIGGEIENLVARIIVTKT